MNVAAVSMNKHSIHRNHKNYQQTTALLPLHLRCHIWLLSYMNVTKQPLPALHANHYWQRVASQLSSVARKREVSRWQPCCHYTGMVVDLNLRREGIVSIEHVNIEGYSESKIDLRLRMKRKLVYSTVHDEPRESDNSSLPPKAKCQIDYEPTHFLRCHSRKNDPADIQTQVRYDAIKHFSRKITSLLCEI